MQLTEKQKAFAYHYVETNHITDAAVKAGYSKDTASAQGSKLLKLAKIQQYIRFLRLSIEEIFQAEAKKSLETLIEIRDNKKTPHTVRLKACIEILDRAGHSATHKLTGSLEAAHSGNVEATHSREMYIIQQLVNTNDDVADAILNAMRNHR